MCLAPRSTSLFCLRQKVRHRASLTLAWKSGSELNQILCKRLRTLKWLQKKIFVEIFLLVDTDCALKVRLIPTHCTVNIFISFIYIYIYIKGLYAVVKHWGTKKNISVDMQKSFLNTWVNIKIPLPVSGHVMWYERWAQSRGGSGGHPLITSSPRLADRVLAVCPLVWFPSPWHAG